MLTSDIDLSFDISDSDFLAISDGQEDFQRKAQATTSSWVRVSREMQSREHCDCCKLFLSLCHVFPQPTSCIYVHVGMTPASLTPSPFQNKPSRSMMILRLYLQQRPIECPPMKYGSSNAPTPPPLPPPPFTPLTRPPQWRTSGPHKLLFQQPSRQDSCQGNISQLEIILSSYLILQDDDLL